VPVKAERNLADFVFNRSGQSYALDAGIFSPGNYQYRSSTKLGSENFTVSGAFSVSSIDIEMLNSVANHNLLSNIARVTNGKVFYPEQLDELKLELENRDDIKTIVYSRKNYKELINLPLILIISVVLLSLEWFLRKRGGHY